MLGPCSSVASEGAVRVRERDPREREQRTDLVAVPDPTERGRELRIAALQRSAGNRAVSGLVQREEAGGGGFTFPTIPAVANLNILPTSPLAGQPAKALAPEVAAKVRAYLEGRRYEIGSKVTDGKISMPEVVQAVRENVPESASAPIADIEAQIRAAFPSLIPPPQRRKRSKEGAGAELAARIANSLSSVPKLRIRVGEGSIALTAAGAVAATTIGSTSVTATGTPGGGEVQVDQGSSSVTIKAGEDSFGLSTKIERATFEAKIEKDDKSGNWSKWELGLRIALVGDEPIEEMTDLPELNETVKQSEQALREIVQHLQGGGSPTDSKVKELMKNVKPAIEGVKRAVQKPAGPRATVGITGKGGDQKLGTFGGVSLIIEF